jgi:hypothetical protein
VEAHGKEGSLSLHACNTSGEFNLADRERVTSVKSSVHVRVGHASKELGLLLPKFGGGNGVERHLIRGGCISFEDFVVLPFLLIFLLECDQSVSLLSLLIVRVAT